MYNAYFKVFNEPLKFDPSRWIQQDTNNINRFASLPFGHGPRMCLGRRVAEQEIYITLIKVCFIETTVIFETKPETS